jgi:hypothetical protein
VKTSSTTGAFFGVQAEGMPRPSSSTLTEPSGAGDLDACRAGQRLVGGVVDHLLQDVQGLSVRVYMPGRCLTGSRPLRTRIEPSEYYAMREEWRVASGARL